MKLDSAKKRLLFLISLTWVVGWFLAYLFGGFVVLNQCRTITPDYPCEYNFKVGGFIFVTFIIPLILIGIWKGTTRIWQWVAKGT
jgi:hypothetical protein